MTISDGLTILAVFLGPIIAIQIQKFIESKNEKKNRKLYIFRALMTTRGNNLSAAHVEALNMIDIEFYGNNKNDKKVIEAWRTYFDHLCRAPDDVTAPDHQTNYSIWTSRRSDLLIDLLYEISGGLEYSFDKAILRSGVYAPKGHQDFENEQTFLRRSLVDVFLDKRAIHIDIKNLNPPPPQGSISDHNERIAQ